MSEAREDRISNKALGARLLALALGMFAFGFLVLPPLYDAFCEITGFAGRTNPTAEHLAEAPDLSRQIRIEFVTNVNEYAPWEFAADVNNMVVNPVRLYYATFTAKNLTADIKTAQAVPSANARAVSHF